MKLNQLIDHTLLKAEATEYEIVTLCKEAIKHQFASVCINPCRVSIASKILKGSGVKVCTVIGFPLGANDTESKMFETKRALECGADEFDMVMNIGFAKEGRWDLVLEEVKGVVEAAKGRSVKVILECCYLSDEEIIKACRVCEEGGAAFVKSSTGMGSCGATVEHIALMRKSVSERVQVKASGGIRSREDALAMVEAGANRLGTSSGVKIIGG